MTFDFEKKFNDAAETMSETAANMQKVVDDMSGKFEGEQSKIDLQLNVQTLTEAIDHKSLKLTRKYQILTDELAENFAGLPEKKAGILEVIGDGTNCRQTFIVFEREREYTINCFNGEWTEWRENALDYNVAEEKYEELDLRHLDPLKFYPVYVQSSAYDINRIKVFRFYHDPGSSANGTMSVFLDYSFIGNSWGGNPIKTVVYQHDYTYKPSILLGYAGFYYSCMFLRGGYLYRTKASRRDTNFILYETKTNYRNDDANPNHDLTFGPISATEAGNHVALLDEQKTCVRWDHSIQQLGK